MTGIRWLPLLLSQHGVPRLRGAGINEAMRNVGRVLLEQPPVAPRISYLHMHLTLHTSLAARNGADDSARPEVCGSRPDHDKDGPIRAGAKRSSVEGDVDHVTASSRDGVVCAN